MARRVISGYVTFDGRYFAEENDAKVYESEHKLFSAFLEVNNHPDPDDQTFKNRYLALKAFITDYHDLLTEYIDARREHWEAPEQDQPADEIRGQPTTGDQSDDPPLRSSSDSEVDEDEPAEANTPSRRKRPK